MGPVVLLDSQDGGTGYLAAGFRNKLECYGDSCRLSSADGTESVFNQNPWDALSEFRENSGWSFGYLGYDLKNFIEKLESQNPDEINAPDLFMIEPEYIFLINRQLGIIQQIDGSPFSIPDAQDLDSGDRMEITEHGNVSAREPYLQAIQRAKRDIFEGLYYEVNLSRRISGEFSGSALDLYHRMKRQGAVPFGAFMHTDAFDVCCASPERFLRKTGKKLLSEPIKGTAEVTGDEAQNHHILESLKNSEKNRAENLMIVDLVRNDLNRIAIKGSVSTGHLFEVRRFPTVFQMVSQVTAEVTDNADPVEIIKACFPMGSMTGAPKISAMQAIERLENYKRGIYSGAIGYFTPDGDFDFNVVIRTAICIGNRWYYSTGGAITSDSDPLDEWNETIIKTRALTGTRQSLKP